MPALTVRSVEGEVAVRTQKPAPARRPDWYSPYEAEKGRGGGRQERYKETTILKSDLDTDTERRANEPTNQFPNQMPRGGRVVGRARDCGKFSVQQAGGQWGNGRTQKQRPDPAFSPREGDRATASAVT